MRQRMLPKQKNDTQDADRAIERHGLRFLIASLPENRINIFNFLAKSYIL